MSRSDQYMGLTHEAAAFLSGLGAKEVRREVFEGAFGSEITLSVYRKYSPEDPVNEYSEYLERVQCEPWSSGPMYFTCLDWFLKKRDGSEVKMGAIYEWHVAPDLKEKGLEFDYSRGAYYV